MRERERECVCVLCGVCLVVCLWWLEVWVWGEKDELSVVVCVQFKRKRKRTSVVVPPAHKE